MDLTGEDSALAAFFSEELGLVLEVDDNDMATVVNMLSAKDIPVTLLGRTLSDKRVRIRYNDEVVLDDDLRVLR